MFSIETLFMLIALLAIDALLLWTGRKRKGR